MDYQDGLDIYGKILIRKKQGDQSQIRRLKQRSRGFSDAIAGDQENTLVIANTLFKQQKKQLYTWTSPDGQYQNQIDNVLCSQREALYSQHKQDQRLTVAQIMNSLL